MPARSAILNVMASAAEKAARALVHDFGEVEQLQVSRKGPADFVSAADRNAEEIIKAELAKARPGYGFLGEESGEISGDQAGRRWIVDPLDGTTNFLHGIPHWSISIALEAEGEIVAGVVYDPVKNEMFSAEKGGGAWLNNRRLRVSSRSAIGDALIVTGITPKSEPELFVAQVGALLRQSVALRRFGSAALDLSYVAAGRFEGYWEMAINAWDVAAGVLLVGEAGGFADDMQGGRNPVHGGSIFASNAALHASLAELLRSPVALPMGVQTEPETGTV